MPLRHSARLQAKRPSSQPDLRDTSHSKKQKAALATAKQSPSSREQDKPSFTPKRQRATGERLPTVTPNKGAGSRLNPSHSIENSNGSTPPPALDRLAVPEGTNALLLIPENHHLISNNLIDEVSPSKPGYVETTTTDILQEGIAHLIRAEPKLKAVIEKFPCHMFSPEGLAEKIDPFRALVSGIIAQQVSGAAAKAINTRFIDLFNSSPSTPITASVPQSRAFPTPSQVIVTPIPTLRSAGLSQRKAEYILGLAQKFASGELTTSFLFTATYESLLSELLKVRGLGKWSVEMFACFALKRMDVFSTGDLGVQRGMARLVGRDVEGLKRKGTEGKVKGGGKWKYLSEKEMIEGAERFKPFRSLFMWYMWRVEDVDVEALDKS